MYRRDIFLAGFVCIIILAVAIRITVLQHREARKCESRGMVTVTAYRTHSGLQCAPYLEAP